MIVSLQDACNFAYVLPPKTPVQPLDKTEIVVPHALQMGWTESPPFFCAATETGQDVIEQFYNQETNIPQHPLETHLTKEISTITSTPPPVTATAIEVYVDNFIAATNNGTQKHIEHLARSMLHRIHCIFPPPSVTHHPGEDPIAMKKLLQKEGMFQHVKENWVGSSMDMNIQ